MRKFILGLMGRGRSREDKEENNEKDKRKKVREGT